MRMAILALALAACGGEAALQEPATLTGGTWVEQDDQGIVWAALTFTPDGHYDRRSSFTPPGEEHGAWAVEAAGLRLAPDGQPAEMHPWQLEGDILRIWLPPPSHVVHEYRRK
jgi:hypothetical protein